MENQATEKQINYINSLKENYDIFTNAVRKAGARKLNDRELGTIGIGGRPIETSTDRFDTYTLKVICQDNKIDLQRLLDIRKDFLDFVGDYTPTSKAEASMIINGLKGEWKRVEFKVFIFEKLGYEITESVDDYRHKFSVKL